MTREEHLNWAKERALDYLRRGEFRNGVASMLSDMNKHTELANHPDLWLGLMITTLADAKRWVKRFR